MCYLMVKHMGIKRDVDPVVRLDQVGVGLLIVFGKLIVLVAFQAQLKVSADTSLRSSKESLFPVALLYLLG